MNVLMLNGSAKPKGCTYTALEEIGRTLAEEGVSYEIFQLGPAPIRDCIGCGQCTEHGCIFTDDAVNAFIEKARHARWLCFRHARCIMPIPAAVCSRFWTVYFTAQATCLRISRARQWPLPGALAPRLRSMRCKSISVFRKCPPLAPPIGIWCMATDRRR